MGLEGERVGINRSSGVGEGESGIDRRSELGVGESGGREDEE